MLGQGDRWAHQVEIEVAGEGFYPKLQSVEAWLTEWDIPYRVGSSLVKRSRRLRICFAEAKFARAFVAHHGGRHVPADEIEAALNADAEDEARYRRLATDSDE